ncbi:MAG: DUF1028 domain-containing protein [Planctomycetes bacterium]|nr:DUF1028 domain-containing protein [Planctomycetota bacterium]
MRRFRSILALALASTLLALPARATWSILIVNTRTGEVAIGSATCLDGFDLEHYLPVVVPGVGVAAAQSAIDASGQNRQRIWNLLHEGADPQVILARLAAHDNQHQSRQYGIADFTHFPASFTGTNCGQACWSIAGEFEDIRYAIQGNVLAGVLPLYDAEEALLSAPGDVSQKLVAAMEAARADGGDGRCSCNLFAPTSCGSPPPSFTYSAYTGFLIVARMGDPESLCNVANGCAGGDYWLNLNAVSGPGGPEPVLLLETAYASWRASLHGRVDQVRSIATPLAQSMPADGATRTQVEVELRDVDGGPVTIPATLSLELDPSSPFVDLGPVENLGGGRFRFAIGAGTQTGSAKVRLTAHHATRSFLLWPPVSVEVEPLAPFACGYQELSASAGASVPLVANFGASEAGASYLMLASASGTQPGTFFGGVQVPLNADGLFFASVNGANGARFVHTFGLLSAAGRAQGAYNAPALSLSGAIGQHFDFAALRLADASGPALATNADGFLVVP